MSEEGEVQGILPGLPRKHEMNSTVKLLQAGSPLPVSQLPFLILVGSVFAGGVVSTESLNISSG